MRTRTFVLAALCIAPLPRDEPPPYASPRFVLERTGKRRDEVAKRVGFDAATEACVRSALDWLARHQADDGGFDPDGFPERCADTKCDGIGKGQHGEPIPCPFDAAISAAATLAFLADGCVPRGDEPPEEAAAPGAQDDRSRHRFTVERALAFLRERTHDDRFALALCTEALAEAEVLEGKGRFRADALRGAAALLELRGEDGGFGYATPWRPGADVPYTALAVPALLAAQDLGAPLPDDLASGVGRFLDGLEAKDGRLAYLADGRRYGYTPTTTNGHLAAALRELLEVGRGGARHRSHLVLVQRTLPEWRIRFETVDVPGKGKVEAQVGDLSLYQWWYGTIAAHRAGDASFRPWYRAARRELVRHQRQDGCAKGSFDPLGTYERQTGGRVFATALAVLILLEPFRHPGRGR